MNGNRIELLEVFNQFKMHDSFASCKFGELRQKYSCAGVKEWVQRIEFYDSKVDQVVMMDLYGLKESTKVYSLNEKEFGDEGFQELCSLFGIGYKIQLKRHAFLCVEDQERLASIAFKKSQDDNIYLTVFNLDSGDSRRGPSLFVEGLWKTSIPKYIIDKFPQLSF